PPLPTLFPYTTLFRSRRDNELGVGANSSNIWGYYQQRDGGDASYRINPAIGPASIIVDKNVGIKSLLSLYQQYGPILFTEFGFRDRKSTRLNSSHVKI